MCSMMPKDASYVDILHTFVKFVHKSEVFINMFYLNIFKRMYIGPRFKTL